MVTLAASVMFMLSKLLLSEPKSAPVVLTLEVMRRLPLRFDDDDHVRLPSDWHMEVSRVGWRVREE